MEIVVYYNVDKPLFKRSVMCPDALDLRAFVSSMKCIFGESVMIDFHFV